MRALNHEEFLQRIDKDYEVLEEYNNNRTKIMVRHKCGYTWRTLGSTLLYKPGCPICSNRLKKNTDVFKDEVKQFYGSEFEVTGEYLNRHSKIQIKHNKCGYEFKSLAKNILKGINCPECLNKEKSLKYRKTHEQFIAEVKRKVDNEYSVLGKYEGKEIPIKMKHDKCGTEFEVTPNHFLSSMNSRCPFCKSSKGEKVIEEWLVSRDLDFLPQFRIKECKNKRPLPFDFAVFNSNKELLFLIEYDGIQHFLPKWGKVEFQRTVSNDKIKNSYCEKEKIHLIRIPYHTKNINLYLDGKTHELLNGNPEPSLFGNDRKV